MSITADTSAVSETLPACCTQGAIHSGTPMGACHDLHGLRTYVASPAVDASKQPTASTTVVFLSDAFGLADGYPNAKLVADEWAARGYRVLLPDILGGDPMSSDMLAVAQKGLVVKTLSRLRAAGKMATVGGPWVLRHREAVTRPIVEGFLRAVRAEPGVDRLVVVGFCFGGRYALLVAGGPLPLADVAVAYHPSLVAVPADVQRIAVPTCIIIGDHDEWMPLARVRKVESVFAALRSKDEGLKAEVIVYEGAKHGFAIRGAIDTPKDKVFRDRALADGLDFVQEAGV